MKKQNLNIIILILLTIAVLYFALREDFTEIMSQIGNANPWWLIVGLILLVGSWFFKTLSLHSMILNFSDKYRVIDTFKLVLTTSFFNGITPFASGGQPFQVYYLKKDGIPISKSTNIIIQNFIVYQIALVFLGIIAILSNYFFHFFAENVILKNLVLIGFIINTCVIIGLFIISFAKRINKFITRNIIKFLGKIKIVKNTSETIENWNKYINNFYQGAKVLVSNKKVFIKAIFFHFAELVCFYLIPMVVFFSLGEYSIDGIESIVATAYIMLMGSFVPIPGGSGGIEYGFIAFFGNFVAGPTLKSAMLVWRFMTYYFSMFVGAITFNLHKRRT